MALTLGDLLRLDSQESRRNRPRHGTGNTEQELPAVRPLEGHPDRRRRGGPVVLANRRYRLVEKHRLQNLGGDPAQNSRKIRLCAYYAGCFQLLRHAWLLRPAPVLRAKPAVRMAWSCNPPPPATTCAESALWWRRSRSPVSEPSAPGPLIPAAAKTPPRSSWAC